MSNQQKINLSSPENLKDILCKHCEEDANRKGLLLLTLPTGFGKTYYVLQYIAHHIREGFSPPIWFITNLKKNLPFDELREMVGEDLYNQYVVFLNSYAHQVKQYFEDGNDIHPDIKAQLSSYKGLRKAINNQKNNIKDREFKDFLNEQLAAKERAFRAELKAFLHTKFPSKAKTPQQRLEFLRQDPKLRWVEKLYPSVLYYEKKVFFCSVDKFYGYVDTIVGPNIQITTPASIEDNIVFIDEFDATKENVKNAIIKNAIKFNQNIVKLFTTIFNGLTVRSFPKSQIEEITNKDLVRLEKKFIELRKAGMDLFDKYELHGHYYFPQYSQVDRAFLFHDMEYLTILDSKDNSNIPGYLERQFQKEMETNIIRVVENRSKNEDRNLLLLINQLRGFISLFSFFVSDFARAYKEIHDTDNPELISVENAIRTTLDLFGITALTRQDYFIDYIFQQVHINNKNSSTEFDLSPLNKGFRYYNFVNNKRHDATTHILYADTLTTPETWLLNLCQNANVIGISATAGFDSSISNYALSHLRQHLRENFHELSLQQQKSLKEEFELKNRYADRRSIKPFAISTKNTPRLGLEEVFSEEEIQNQFIYDFSDLKPHEVERYVKTAKAYRYFIQHKDIYSFLCLLNKFPKNGAEENFQRKLLKNMFVELRIEILGESEGEAKKKVSDELEIIDSNDFENRQLEVNQKLKEGESVFVISTYQTIGAGQNIQYVPHEDIPVVDVNELDYGNGKKDYDAIYLEKPTNLLNYFKDGETIGDRELLEYLFEVEYLIEGGAISTKEKRERIRYAFKRKNRKGGRAPSNKNLFKRRIIYLHFCRVIIQAMGRLSRTKLKSPITHILYDENIQEYLKHFQPAGFLLVKEFEALYEHCLSGTVVSADNNLDIEHINIYHSKTFATLLRRLTRRIPDWENHEIKFWKNLRRFVLRHPTISKKELLKSNLQKFYIQAPNGYKSNKYSFQSSDDFKHNLTIDFAKTNGKEVSAEGAALSLLMHVGFIKTFFENKQNKFATDFIANEYILSPPLFQNIYLGALGEEVGKCIFNEYGIKLLNLEEGEYELFDFKTENGIYIDFKFWGADTMVSAIEQKEKIRRKMKKANAAKVLIINIIRPRREYAIQIDEDHIIEIPGLICAEDKNIISESIKSINQIILNHE